MTAKELPLTDKQLKAIQKLAKRYRLKTGETIAIACLSFLDGYELSPENEGYFMEARRKFIGKKLVPI